MNLLKYKISIFQKLIVISLLILPLVAFAAPKKSLTKMKESLGKSSNDIFELGAQIRSLEKKLGSKNEQYLTHLEKIKKLDTFVGQIREKVRDNKSKLDSEVERVTFAYETLLLNELHPESAEHLLKQKILRKMLISEIDELEQIEIKNKNLLTSLEAYENQIFEMKQNEKSVYELIVGMENQKKNLSKVYLDKVAVKNELEQKLEIEQARESAYAKTSSRQVLKGNFPIELSLPIAKYSKVKKSNKGVTFSYIGRKNLRAMAGGEVVYTGELASYGKVLILDHGNEIRSVLLGDVAYNVQKGQKVAKGEVLGTTMSDPGITKTLYYEIRNKNIAQNTYKILRTEKVL